MPLTHLQLHHHLLHPLATWLERRLDDTAGDAGEDSRTYGLTIVDPGRLHTDGAVRAACIATGVTADDHGAADELARFDAIARVQRHGGSWHVVTLIVNP